MGVRDRGDARLRHYAWPADAGPVPLLLGFTLGRIIEFNFQSAVSIYGIWGLLTRPLTIVLLALAIGIAITFSRMGNIGAGGAALSEDDAPPPTRGADRPAPGGGSGDEAPAKARGLSLSPAALFTLAIIGMAAWALWEATTAFTACGKVFPVALSAAVIALAGVQLVFDHPPAPRHPRAGVNLPLSPHLQPSPTCHPPLAPSRPRPLRSSNDDPHTAFERTGEGMRRRCLKLSQNVSFCLIPVAF